jgi:hypothetical protein
MKPDAEHIAEFICTGMQLVAILNSGGTIAHVASSDTEASVAWACERNAQGDNLYWSPNIVREGLAKKATKLDIVAVSALFVDIDPLDGENAETARARTFAAVKQENPGIPGPPTFVVFSGNGHQAVWLLDKSVAVDEAGRADYENRNTALVRTLGGDNCWNIDRILRLPGTVNWPNAKKKASGRVAALACIVEKNPTALYQLSDFPQGPEPEKPIRRGVALKISPVSPISESDLFFSVADHSLRYLIQNGRDPSAQPGQHLDRSKQVYKAVCRLMR